MHITGFAENILIFARYVLILQTTIRPDLLAEEAFLIVQLDKSLLLLFFVGKIYFLLMLLLYFRYHC